MGWLSTKGYCATAGGWCVSGRVVDIEHPGKFSSIFPPKVSAYYRCNQRTERFLAGFIEQAGVVIFTPQAFADLGTRKAVDWALGIGASSRQPNTPIAGKGCLLLSEDPSGSGNLVPKSRHIGQSYRRPSSHAVATNRSIRSKLVGPFDASAGTSGIPHGRPKPNNSHGQNDHSTPAHGAQEHGDCWTSKWTGDSRVEALGQTARERRRDRPITAIGDCERQEAVAKRCPLRTRLDCRSHGLVRACCGASARVLPLFLGGLASARHSLLRRSSFLGHLSWS